MKLIEGAGGIGAGGGGNQKPQKPRPPVITQDDPGLRTISFAKMQFLLCEGPILGPAVGLEESVFLDETPIRTANGVSPQPEDLVVSFGRSTWEQTAVPGYGSVSNVIGVDKTVKEGLPVTQQVIATDPTVAYSARVLLTWQGLVRTIVSGEKAGDVLPHDCPYSITYTDNLGVQRGPGTIQLNDKFAGPFQREAEFALDGPGPWTIMVQRLQQDDDKREAGTNNTEQYQSTFSFSSVVLSTWIGLRYPNSAILTLGVRADQYSELPAVAVDLHGIIMRVPSNYDPGTRTYGGLWDGGFKWAYTNNPAWVMYDLFLNDRYGLGQYIDPLLTDKWTLYEIGKYCDQMVPDGKGGWEPRFTCNIILQTAEDAWTVLQQFSSIFRGAIYYASSSIVTVQDRKKDCVYTFNEANTIEQFDDSGEVSQGNFSYAGSAKRARHTAVLVSWDDPADNYQPRVEYVADQAGMLKLGYRPLQLRLMGVTSRGQALRAANWALLTESLLDDTISFATGMLGAALRPGDLIKIADPNKAAIRMGGRVVDLAADDVVTVDEAPKNPPGGWGGATFSFMAPDTDGQPVLRTGAVMPPVADAPNDLKVVWSTGDRPLPGWPFLIEVPGRTAQQFRILTISEQSGDDGITYGITALRYRGDIYDAVDFGSPLGDDGTAIWKPGRIDPPTWTVAQVVWDGGQAKLDLAWQPAASDINLGDFNLSVSSYRLQYLEGQKQADGSITWSRNWIEASRASANTDRIIVSGYTNATVYKVRVAAISRVGLQSVWAERQALTLEEWMPMPDLSKDGKLTHINLPTGGHAFSLAITGTRIPPYVRGKLVEVQEGGPGDAWIVATSSNLQAVDEWAFGAIRAGLAAGASKAVRVSLTTFVPGLAGHSYAIDHVDRLEIVPPSPEGLRVVLEGGRQSYAGQRRFSWRAGKTPFPQNWPKGEATDIVSYDIRFIQGLSPNWEQALPLLSDGITGDQTWFETNLFDAGQWVVMIRAKDRTGWLSDTFAAVAIGIGDPIPTNAVETLYLGPLGWAGTLVNLERVGTELVQIDPSLPGEYIFPFYNNYTDAQLVITTNATGTYRWEVEEGGRDTDLFYLPPLGDPLYYLGSDPMYPTPGAAAINGYHPYAPNELVKEGYYNYKLTIISLDGTTPASVQDVTMIFDYPDVVWTGEDVAVDAAGTQVDFPPGTFRKLKAVSLTVQDDPTTPGAAINAIILLKDKDYVEIVPLDSAGNRVAALVDIFAVGF